VGYRLGWSGGSRFRRFGSQRSALFKEPQMAELLGLGFMLLALAGLTLVALVKE
jgi:hypothetical protein